MVVGSCSLGLLDSGDCLPGDSRRGSALVDCTRTAGALASAATGGPTAALALWRRGALRGGQAGGAGDCEMAPDATTLAIAALANSPERGQVLC